MHNSKGNKRWLISSNSLTDNIMPSGGKCIFSSKVLDKYSWTDADPCCKYSAICKYCKSTINISNGFEKLDRHAVTAKHKEEIANRTVKVNYKLDSYVKSCADCCCFLKRGWTEQFCW